MLKVKLVTDEGDYDYCTTLEIHHNGKMVKSFSDGGEPEDSSFMRDWYWVPETIEWAYKKGVEDGSKG